MKRIYDFLEIVMNWIVTIINWICDFIYNTYKLAPPLICIFLIVSLPYEDLLDFILLVISVIIFCKFSIEYDANSEKKDKLEALENMIQKDENINTIFKNELSEVKEINYIKEYYKKHHKK